MEREREREENIKIIIITYHGSLNISQNVQQPTILISCLCRLSHGLHCSTCSLQPLFCLLSAFFQEVIVILWRFILHFAVLSKCFCFKPTQATTFSFPTQNYLFYNSYRPDNFSIVLPDLVLSCLCLSI